MRIGLLGAPGSGKSKLARALGEEHGLKVVDNYVQRLQKKTDLALGPWSSYPEHFMVASKRLEEEYAAGFDKRITVTTILDTITYAAFHADVSLRKDKEAVRANYQAAQSAMGGLGLLFAETWDYDISFFLPYSEKEYEKRKDTWQVALDSAYVDVIDSFSPEGCYILAGNHDERLESVNNMIAAIEKDEDEPETTTTD